MGILEENNELFRKLISQISSMQEQIHRLELKLSLSSCPDMAEAASFLGIHKQTLLEKVNRGEIPYSQERKGTKITFMRDDLISYKQKNYKTLHS